ncbi:MAG: FlgD immunoglobulin-like domain containing protein [Candidatus Limnocylindrales bacterium]
MRLTAATTERSAGRPAAAWLVVVLTAVVMAIAIGFAPASAGSAEAASSLKAVVIVGPSGSLQSSNNAAGKAIADLAASYGMDVRRVFHPYATWSKVLDNIQGASIVVYLGHGNGWPSPYSPYQEDTKDGFGLNASSGSSTVKYWGATPIARSIDLAPNAVVLLNHLCYASGNSEPGRSAPSQSGAKQRVDNYANGFIRAGARAVFAYGHQDVRSVITALMTTHDTMDEIFMGTGYRGGRDIRFPSARVSGYDVHMDPESSTGYYRALTGRLSMTADQVTGAPFARTDLAPGTFAVPGLARVRDGLTVDVVDAPGGSVVGALESGTLVALTEASTAGPDGRAYLGIGSPTEGFVATDQLRPEDSTGPRPWEIEPQPLAFSPNDDGDLDELGIDVTWSENADWTAKVEQQDGTDLASWSGEGESGSFSWNGRSDGDRLPDGTYRLTVRATDLLGNDGTPATRNVTIDTVAPDVALRGAAADATTLESARTFTPNGDGSVDTIGIGYDVSEAGRVDLIVRNAADDVVRRVSVGAGEGNGSIEWDGRGDGGSMVADGTYELTVRASDAAGNRSPANRTYARVFTALKCISRSRSPIYTADADKLAASTTFGFTLTKAATLDWTIRRPDGSVLLTRLDDAAATPGAFSWKWTGKDQTGAYVPDGQYVSVIEATTSAGTISQVASVWVGAFRIVPSTARLDRGKTVTVTITTTEPLSYKPRLVVSQPGVAAYKLLTTKKSSTTYAVTFKVKAGGPAGTVTLKAYARDSGDRLQRSYLSLPLD